MKPHLQLVLDRLDRSHGCVPKIVSEERNAIYVPARVAAALVPKLAELGVQVVDIGVWEYRRLTDPPACWGLGGPVDDQKAGTFHECVELGWAVDEALRADSAQAINGAAARYLESLFDTDAYRAVGDARLYVELFLEFPDDQPIPGRYPEPTC